MRQCWWSAEGSALHGPTDLYQSDSDQTGPRFGPILSKNIKIDE